MPSEQRIFEVSADGFNTVRSFSAPGDRAHGLGWLQEDLWCVDTNLREIHSYDLDSGDVKQTIELSESDPEPHGMTVWEGEFWYCDATTSAVCRVVSE